MLGGDRGALLRRMFAKQTCSCRRSAGVDGGTQCARSSRAGLLIGLNPLRVGAEVSISSWEGREYCDIDCTIMAGT